MFKGDVTGGERWESVILAVLQDINISCHLVGGCFVHPSAPCSNKDIMSEGEF